MSGLADGQSVAVALDLRQAKKFAATLGSDDNLTGLYHAKRRSLEVRSDLGSLSQVKRWFATEPADELRNVVLEKFGEPSYVQPSDPEVIRRALTFTRLFVDRDELHDQWPSIEIRNGVASAMPRMSGNRLGVFSSEKLANLDLGVRYEHIDRLTSLLARFEPSQTHLFDTHNYHIFYDGQRCLGFEKALSGTPALPTGLKLAAYCRTVVSRDLLLDQLNHLAAIRRCDLTRDFLVTLRIEGWLEGKLWLRTRDGGGRSHGSGWTECGRTRCDVHSHRPGIYFRALSLQNLREVVAHFKTPYIILEELSTGALRLPMDERDFQTTAFLASVPGAMLEFR
jgi:hypothetical protein